IVGAAFLARRRLGRFRARLRGFRSRLGLRRMSGAFADDVAGALVLAQPLERWMAQRSIARPLGEAYFADEVGSDPMCASSLGARRWIDEWRLVGCELLQRGGERLQRRVVEPGAHLAAVT